MDEKTAQQIAHSPTYQKLVRQRSRFGWTLTAIMLVVYFGYICLVAFNREFLARPIGAGVTTMSIPIGIGVILFTILITGFYVRRANSEYDALTDEITRGKKS
jgi:uncharacterized membrane protein (DUF485 family)